MRRAVPAHRCAGRRVVTRPRGFTLAETLIAAGIVASVGAMCALLASTGTSGMRSAWNRSDDVGAAAALLDRISTDVRGASDAYLENASTLRLDATVIVAGGGTRVDCVRYTASSGAGGLVISREVKVGSAAWKMEPMRPVAALAQRPDGIAPAIAFTASPGTGRVTIELDTDVLAIEQTVYRRFG